MAQRSYYLVSQMKCFLLPLAGVLDGNMLMQKIMGKNVSISSLGRKFRASREEY